MFGDGFPEHEINLIMDEATSNRSRGISYEDFLSQWDDDYDEFMQQWSQNMIQRVSGVGETLTADNERTDMVSELSFDGSASSHEHGRADYLEGKAVSERKMQAVMAH